MSNPLLEKHALERQAAFEVGWAIGYQQAMDYIAVALNEPETMGKSVMSGERIDRILRRVQELQREFMPAFNPRTDPEADVYQERLDALQRRIYKDRFQDFRTRYPDLKEVLYGRRKR